MGQQTIQNIASLEVRRIEKLKPEARIIEDLKTHYKEKLGELDLSKFTLLVMILKTVNNIYTNGTMAEYYLILELEKLYNQFVENLFKFLYNAA